MLRLSFELSASLFQSFLTIWFLARFHGHKYWGDSFSAHFSLLLFAVTLLGDYFLPGFNFLSFGLIFGVSLLYALMICSKAYPQAILSVCLIQTDTMLSGTLLYSIMSHLVNDFDMAIQGSDSLIRYIYLAAGNLLFFAVAKGILHLFAKGGPLELRTSIIMFIAFGLTLLGLGATVKIADREFSREIKNPVVILTCIFLAVNVILYLLVGQIQRLEKVKLELELTRERLESEKKRFQDVSAMLETCRQIRHDMKQHLTMIDGYLTDGKTEECKTYVKGLFSSIDGMTGHLIQTDNPIIDYLVNTKLGQLKDIQVLVTGDTGNFPDIQDLDFSCLLGNILDNAVEAVNAIPLAGNGAHFSERKIELTFAEFRKNWVIVCQNSIAGPVLEKNQYLNSTKHDSGEHGLGHKVIAKIVEKYDGIVTYFEENHMFGIQVILPQKKKVGLSTQKQERILN